MHHLAGIIHGYCEHIIPEGPIKHLTQVYILNMQTQDEAVLPETVSLFLQELWMEPYQMSNREVLWVSVGQRASNGLFKFEDDQIVQDSNCTSVVWLWPGFEIFSQTSNFDSS